MWISKLLLLNLTTIFLLCPYLSFSQNDVLNINYVNGQVKKIPIVEIDYLEFDESTKVEDYTIFDNNQEFKIYPNPSENAINIVFFLKKNNNVNISIFNNFGTKIKNIDLLNCSNGENIIVWNGKNNVDKIIPQGIYYICISAGNQTFVSNLINSQI